MQPEGIKIRKLDNEVGDQFLKKNYIFGTPCIKEQGVGLTVFKFNNMNLIVLHLNEGQNLCIEYRQGPVLRHGVTVNYINMRTRRYIYVA